MAIDAATRRLVRERAHHYCEYCRLHQDELAFIAFHMEHIISKKHDGPDDDSNLALSCHWCNFNKGTDIATLVDNLLVPLFNPRTQRWEEHFARRGTLIVSLSSTGRGTVRLLDMNDSDRQQIRINTIRQS